MPPKAKRPIQRRARKAGKTPRSTRTLQNPTPLDDTKLKQLYSTMLGCRIASERARLLLKQGKLAGEVTVATGHEAAEVGALIDLLADDCVAPGRGDLGARFIRGMSLKAIFAELRAQAGGNGFVGPARRQHTLQTMIAPALSLGAQLNLATGVAWSLKRHGKAGVAVVAFSSNESGSCLDAIRFSAAHKLPIVHIVHGDGPSVRDSLERATAGAHQPMPPAFMVDGIDVVAVYRVAQEAIRRARQGHGPALIECQTCIWDTHHENDSQNRQPNSVRAEQSTDPIERMEAYLQRKGLWSSSWKHKLTERFNKQLDRAVRNGRRSHGYRSGRD